MPTAYPLDLYLQVRSASGPSFSPDGRFVSFLTNVTGVAQLWQVPVEGGWPVQLTFTRESVRSAHYSPRRHELIYSMDTGGNERTQLYRLRGVGGGTDHGIGDGWVSDDLSRQPKAVHGFGGWSHDGEQIVFSANREEPSRFDIYVQKITANGERQAAEAARLVARGPGGYYAPVGWSPDDASLLVSRVEWNSNQDLYAIDVAKGTSKRLTPHEGDVQHHSACWSADGKSVYCISTAQGRDLPGLAQIDVATAKLTFLETPDHEIEGVHASPKGRWLVWLTNVDGVSQLHLRDLRGAAKHEFKAPGHGVIHGITFAPDDSKLAYVFDGPRHNLDIHILDLKPGEASKGRQLTHSSRCGLPFAEFVEPELIHYPTFDDRKIPAWFYKPAPGANTPGSPARLPPVIVYPHGGPESQYRPTFNALFQYFVARGYAVLAPNVRGSTGYGVTYMNLDNTVKRMDSVKDLAHAAFWLRDQKQGDPKRLAVYGGSYGGFMVLAQVTNYPELWAAGVDIVGIANWITFLEKTGAYRRAHRAKEYGNLTEHRAFLEKISPINHVDKIKCPMMIIHGAQDPRVPIGESEQIVAALKKRSVPVDYLRYEDEGHGLAKLQNRLDAYPKMMDFLAKYLKQDKGGRLIMAFANYKTLGEAARAHQIHVQVASFLQPKPFPVDERFRSELQFALENINVRVSEAAICEFLIAPVLREVWRAYSDSLQIWSHAPFSRGEPLLGVPDYYFSRRSRLGLVNDEPPYVLVVEAKKDDFDAGWGQCLAAMLAAQQLNGLPPRPIYGCVSNGSLWQFGKLHEQDFMREFNEFVLSDLPSLFAAWNYIMFQAKEQALVPAA